MPEYNTTSLPIYKPTSWAGVVPETEQAYDIRAIRFKEKRREAAFGRANGILSDGETKVEFFIFELGIDFGIAGNTSQARYTRDFYAHNIILPSLKVRAQCLDQGDYGTLTEFIHQSQKKAVGNSANNTTQLEAKGGGIKVSRHFSNNFTMKGPHKRTCAQGFIPRIERKYKQGEYAPIFDFAFTVAQSFDGLYQDSAASVFENQQQSWVEILKALTTPFTPSFEKTETASNSKPKSAPASQPEEPTPPTVELIQGLKGNGFE